jgi:hypothetical protein
MENNGKRSSFGFSVKPDLSEYKKKVPEPVAKEEKENNAEHGEKVTDLLKDATVGLALSTRDLILYVVLWYICYPALMFTTFYMAERFLRIKLDQFTPITALNAFITICTGTYFAYYLLASFINEPAEPAAYLDEKPFFYQRIAWYAGLMSFVLYMSDLLNLDTLQNPEVIRLFTIFYLLYLSTVTVFRHFNGQVSKRR